jgi:hypothetical protein
MLLCWVVWFLDNPDNAIKYGLLAIVLFIAGWLFFYVLLLFHEDVGKLLTAIMIAGIVYFFWWYISEVFKNIRSIK